MKPSMRILIAAVLATSSAAAQLQGTYSGSTNLPIPPSGSGGAPGGCGSGTPNTTEFTVNVPDAFVLSHISCELTLVHTFVGDLTITLSHCGTSVVLYDQSPLSSDDLNGTYAFDDSAIQYFANVVNGAGTVVPPGSYLPVNPLTPFHGMSSAGAWTIAICDHAMADAGVLTAMSLELFGAHPFGGTISPPLGIPDGNFGCVLPVTHAINVPAGTPGIVDVVNVTIGLIHSYVRDLNITIAHDGVAVTLSGAGSIKAGVGVQGLYTFTNLPGAWSTFDEAASGLPVGFTIPPWTYVPDQSLEAFTGHPQGGTWLVTICDGAASDVGTFTSASIEFSNSPYGLSLSQPSGSSSLVFSNTGGSPGHFFVNLVTLVPGDFPYGWLNGLDIPLPEIVNQVSLGAPFAGILDACGSKTTPVYTPIPSGLALQLTSFELDQNGLPVASVPAFQYVTF